MGKKRKEIAYTEVTTPTTKSDNVRLPIANDEKGKNVTHLLASEHNTVSNGEITNITNNEDHRVLIPESNSVKELPISCISENILESLEAYKEKLNEGIKRLIEKIKGVEMSIEIVRKEFLKEEYSRKEEYLKDLKQKGISLKVPPMDDNIKGFSDVIDE